MSWGDFGTWLGTICSVVGAGIAVYQAKRATTAAASAIQARNDIKSKNDQAKIISLEGVLTIAFNAMDKYGPGTNLARLKGVNFDDDAQKVREFTAQFAHDKIVLKKLFGNNIDNVRKRINQLLVEFAAIETDDNYREKGNAIYVEITEFRGNLRSKIELGIFD